MLALRRGTSSAEFNSDSLGGADLFPCTIDERRVRDVEKSDHVDALRFKQPLDLETVLHGEERRSRCAGEPRRDTVL